MKGIELIDLYQDLRLKDILPPLDAHLSLIAKKHNLYVDFSNKGYSGDKEAPMDRIGLLDYILQNFATETSSGVEAIEFLKWSYEFYRSGDDMDNVFTPEQLYQFFKNNKYGNK